MYLKNMKKILLHISAILLTLLVGIQTTSAATSPVDELLSEVKNQPKTAINQDMYLKLYKEINDNPHEKAIKAITKKYGMTEDQIKQIVQDGNLAPLMKSKKGLTVDKALLQYKKISNDYNIELETENLRSELELQTKPSEIFMDGDTSNSEFDVLYDLTVIEVILFNESSTSEFGGQFISPDFDFSDKEDKAFTDDLFDKNSSGSKTDEQTSKIEFSPLSCRAEKSSLDEALSNFDGNKQRNQNGNGADNQNDNGNNATKPEFPKSESDKWPSKYLCPDGGFYCINISFDMESAKAYGKLDNCVACHVQNINKALDKMLSKPLSANKLSGNLFEVPKCKASYKNLPIDMNIILLAVAPPRQANQDKYIKLNIERDWNKLVEKFNTYFYKTKKPTQQATVENRTIKEAMQASSDSATIDEITLRSQERIQTVKNETRESLESAEKGNNTELNNTKYQMTSNELEAMNQAFNTILNQLKAMKTPCTDLSNKAYCS